MAFISHFLGLKFFLLLTAQNSCITSSEDFRSRSEVSFRDNASKRGNSTVGKKAMFFYGKSGELVLIHWDDGVTHMCVWHDTVKTPTHSTPVALMHKRGLINRSGRTPLPLICMPIPQIKQHIICCYMFLRSPSVFAKVTSATDCVSNAMVVSSSHPFSRYHLPFHLKRQLGVAFPKMAYSQCRFIAWKLSIGLVPYLAFS